MKNIILISLFILSFTAVGQETQTDTIVFTDIHLEEIGNPSAYIEYQNSRGEKLSDLRFNNYHVLVDNKVLFEYEDDIIIYFNKEYAKEIMGKKILLTFYEKEIPYFGVVPFVISLNFID